MATMAEMVIPPLTKGQYTWDNQNNCLLFVSNDAPLDTKDKRRKNRNAPASKAPERKRDEMSSFFLPYSTGAGMPSIKGGARTIGPPRGSPKLGVSADYSQTITLKDVKAVALDNLEREMVSAGTVVSLSFEHLMNTLEFDGFLISLLHYFTCFFDKLEQELKPQKTSFLQPSKAELQAIADTKKKMEVTKRKLGQSYCVLILGLGIEKQHHMGCGKKRVSSTHRDMKMYEDLYLFCTYVVWITFRQKEFERVKIEVGNMLRSEVFNPALQAKQRASVAAEAKLQSSRKEKKELPKTNVAPAETSRKRTGPKTIHEKVEERLAVKLPIMERLTPAQHRRKTGKRPAIRTAVYQRSTALVSLLPLPKEESDYLFKSIKAKSKAKSLEDEDMECAMPDLMAQKIGIIGEKTDLFNMTNLMPKSMENEEDTESTDDDNARDSNTPTPSEHRLSRQGDAISRVTTAE